MRMNVHFGCERLMPQNYDLYMGLRDWHTNQWFIDVKQLLDYAEMWTRARKFELIQHPKNLQVYAQINLIGYI